MSKKDSEIEKICAMCEMSQKIFDEDNVLCRKRGIVSATGYCKKFVYDVLKRVPPKSPKVPPLRYIDIDGDEDNNENSESMNTSEE